MRLLLRFKTDLCRCNHPEHLTETKNENRKKRNFTISTHTQTLDYRFLHGTILKTG